MKTCSFCHVAVVGMPFCFLLQNFADIGQSVNELWPKTRFSELSAAQQSEIRELLDEYSEIFSDVPRVTHSIKLN